MYTNYYYTLESCVCALYKVYRAVYIQGSCTKAVPTYILTGCQAEFNTTEGVIHSQGYPGPYQDHQNCNYTIHILPDHVLKMTLFVDINRSGSCRTEFLKLQHGYFMYNRRLCGYMSNISYYIRDANVTSTTLRFRTRDLNSVNEHPSGGFHIHFRQVLRSSVSAEQLNQVHNGSHTIPYQDRPWLKF